MKRDASKRHGSWLMVFLICVLAVPTCGMFMGELVLPENWTADEAALELIKPWVFTGALLGVAHLFIRPVLRLLSAPLGCLTLGLFGFVIDVGLLYGCAYLVPGFTLSGPVYAVLTAMLINIICAITASR